jgi:hypothetical protein
MVRGFYIKSRSKKKKQEPIGDRYVLGVPVMRVKEWTTAQTFLLKFYYIKYA